MRFRLNLSLQVDSRMIRDTLGRRTTALPSVMALERPSNNMFAEVPPGICFPIRGALFQHDMIWYSHSRVPFQLWINSMSTHFTWVEMGFIYAAAVRNLDHVHRKSHVFLTH